jgi:acetoin utilization deacetylase AcuC-like enzyme
MSRLSIVYHEVYEVDIGAHVFATAKYRLVRERLLAEGAILASDLVRSETATDEQMGRVHSPRYLDKLRSCSFTPWEIVQLEVPYSPEFREAVWLCAGGSIQTARLALEHGGALHLGGGFHHAFADHGEGFCPANDVAIAVRTLLAEGAVARAVIVDCDLHQGNGTAAIFAAEPAVFTFSMHQENNYPALKPPGDLDIGLPDRTGDESYLELLGRHLPELLERQRPQLAFYLAGADPYEHDQLGGLSLTLEGLRRRDELVLHTLARLGIPAATVLAGGYAWSRDDTVSIHCATVLEAQRAISTRGGLQSP